MKGHAFLIYLTFKEKNRIKISSICEIINSIKRNSDYLNIVDYECVSNSFQVNLNNYKLEKIEEGKNEGILQKSNINELTIGKNKDNFMKINSAYKIIDFMKILNFEIKKIQNQTSKDYIFDFILEGKLNKDAIKYPIKGKLELNEIHDKIDCDVTKENLHCKLDVNNYKYISSFSFKTYKLEGSYSIYLSNLEKIWLLNRNNHENSEKKSNVKLIILFGSGGLIAIGIVISICIYISKRPNSNYHSIKSKID